jgi:hypothetical protein
MKYLLQMLVALLTIECCSCVAGKATSVQPMRTCVVGAIPSGVDAIAFQTALAQAQRFSDRIYGSDCFVCAEVVGDEPTSYMLHITSPIEDMLLNTSAEIKVRKSDGAVLSKAQYHSCYARTKDWGNKDLTTRWSGRDHE